MWLSIGIDDALVLGPTSFFKQLRPNAILLSSGSGVVEHWDGCCSCPGTDKLFNPTLLSNGSDVVVVGIDAVLVLGPTFF